MTEGAMLSPANALVTDEFEWGTITWMAQVRSGTRRR